MKANPAANPVIIKGTDLFNVLAIAFKFPIDPFNKAESANTGDLPTANIKIEAIKKDNNIDKTERKTTLSKILSKSQSLNFFIIYCSSIFFPAMSSPISSVVNYSEGLQSKISPLYITAIRSDNFCTSSKSADIKRIALPSERSFRNC